MTHKQLVLIDLCKRLPHHVKVEITVLETNKVIIEEFDYMWLGILYYDNPYHIIKPYLRPLSSMTDEEKEKLRQEQIKDEQLFADCIKNHPEMRGLIIPHFAADWCDKNMFDYRTAPDENGEEKTMIELGLALPALEGMYGKEL